MNQNPEAIEGLPVSTKEKAVRYAGYAATLASAIAIINVFMPFINKALTLLVNGMFSVIQLGLMGVGILLGSVFFMQMWPVYKKLVESLANKATWALFEYDPITPMELWLKEVRRDRQTVEGEYMNVEGVIANSQQKIADNLKKAEHGDKLFATAVRSYGENSTEAKLQALEPSRLRQTAENIQQKLEGLQLAREILKQVVEATVFTERAAEVDVEGLKEEWETSKNIERASDSAYRAVAGRSERKQNAMMSMKIIHDKYANSFGRLQGLHRLSRELITSIDMEKGTFHQEALDRLKAESQFITGVKAPQMLEAKQVSQVGPVSFYAVPTEQVKASQHR